MADALARNAASRPTWPVYRMLDAAGGVQDSITCAGAHYAAQALAAFLTGPVGLRPGDRAVLCYPPGAPGFAVPKLKRQKNTMVAPASGYWAHWGGP